MICLRKKRVIVAMVLGWAVSVTSAAFAAETTTPYDRAKTAYEAAISRHNAGKFQEAIELWTSFISGPGVTSDKLPGAYLALADCHYRLKEFAKCEAAADEMIKRFYPSRFWVYAYGTKLACIRELKENDRYLEAVATLIQRAGCVPPRLWGAYGTGRPADAGEWHHSLPWTTFPNAIYGQFLPRDDWAVDLLAMCDTPERAGRGLKLAEKMFTAKPEDIPLDWQNIHLCLLRQSGDAAAAQKMMKTYIDGWGKDPRGVSLYLGQAAYLDKLKKPAEVDAIWEELIKTYGGYGNLERSLYYRVSQLMEQKRLEDGIRMAREYVRLYPAALDAGNFYGYWMYTVEAWMTAATKLAASGNQGELKNLAAYLAEVQQKGFPVPRHDGLPWRLRLGVLLKDADMAVKAAEELLGDAGWSGGNFDFVRSVGESFPPVAKVIESARARRKIPVADPKSKAVGMYTDLMKRLGEDQPRFAEEIAQEMFDKHRDDAATIDAVAEMAKYYYNKVLAEPRDKWMNRMVQAYPQHPRTQAILALQVEAERGQRNYPRVAAVSDTLMRLFPGAAASYWSARLEAYTAAQDSAGATAFVRACYGERATRDASALSTLLAHERYVKWDGKAFGDRWMEMSRRLAGTRGEVVCLIFAYDTYLSSAGPPQYAQAHEVAKSLRTQTLDGHTRWCYEFSEAGLLLAEKKPTEAAKAFSDILSGPGLGQNGWRNLYGRLYYSGMAGPFVEQKKLEEGLALVKKMRSVTTTKEDRFALLWLEAYMLENGGQRPAASKKYFELASDYPMPGLVTSLISSGIGCLSPAPEMHTAAQKWIKEFGGAQDFVPQLLYGQGVTYLQHKQLAGLNQIRGRLSRSYAACELRDQLEDQVQAALNPPKKPPAGK